LSLLLIRNSCWTLLNLLPFLNGMLLIFKPLFLLCNSPNFYVANSYFFLHPF
jgi:hypothetical protein